MRLLSFRIQNFRCFDDETIEVPKNLHLVTGRNDGGKSALLDALSLFFDKRPDLDQEDFRMTTPSGRDYAEEITLTARIRRGETEEDYRCICRWDSGESERIYRKKTSVPENEDLRHLVLNFSDTDCYSAAEGRAEMERWGIPRDEQETYKSDRHDQIRRHASKKPQIEKWVDGVRPDLSVEMYNSEESIDLRKYLERYLRKNVDAEVGEIRENESYREVEQQLRDASNAKIDQLRNIFDGYDYAEDSTNLTPNVTVDLTRGLVVEDFLVKQDGENRHLSKLGAAKRRKLVLAMHEWDMTRIEELRVEQDSDGGEGSDDEGLLLLYDEPDTHFDYEAQRKLFRILQRLAVVPNAQVIVATHSLNLIDRVDFDRIVHLERRSHPDGELKTKTVKLTHQGEVHDIARRLGLRNHIVLNACVLCTEGKTEEKLIPELYYKVRERTLSSIGVEVVRGADRGDDATWRLTQHMLKNGRDVFLMLDSDVQNSDKKIDRDAIREFNETEAENLISSDSNLAFIGEKEIEDAFSDAVLAEAYDSYLESLGYGLSKGDTALDVVKKYRGHNHGICKGLHKHIYVDLGTETAFSKTAFSNHLLDVLNQDGDLDRIPDCLMDAFDLLDEYVGATSTRL
jgi:predicted ATP-dependent endonuclease of OLD family